MVKSKFLWGMKHFAPRYIQLTPTLGELHWNLEPSDGLLGVQLGWMDWLGKETAGEILEVRQGFTALGIRWKTAQSQERFARTISSVSVPPSPLSQKIWEIPVCYGQEYGTDLGSLALGKRMRVNDLIDLHSAGIYRIHFFGFLPGFMYLSGLPEVLHTPRKAVPDRSVARGSVGIGGPQTGIYPMESPGGWHVLGRTPVQLFESGQNPPVWASPGDRIQFIKIGAGEMKRMLENPVAPTCR